MRLGLHQSARLEQRLIQSPQMIQAMQILQLPLLDLSERIEQELMENPFLEVEESERDGNNEDGAGAEARAAEAASPTDAPQEMTQADAADTMLDFFDRIERDHGDGSRGQVSVSSEDGDTKYEAMMNAPESAQTFAASLLDQVSSLELTERERTVLEYVVWSLDERGYLTETPATLAAELTREVRRTLTAAEAETARAGGHGDAVLLDDEVEALGLAAQTEGGTSPAGPPQVASSSGPAIALDDDEEDLSAEELVVTEDEVRDALERLRETVHPGIGALDLKECLLLQLPGKGLWNPFMRRLVERHLDDIRANRLPQIARATDRDMEDVKAAIELLQGLDPAPGSEFGDTTAEVIHPEVIVELDDDAVIVRLDRERTPRLRLSPMYQTQAFRALLKDGDKDAREWAKKRLEAAGWFLDALAQRQSTLERISNALFIRQKAFLARGMEALKPLRMQEIADEVGVHISTVSRAVAGKYAQTPRGIFALKFFFTGGTTKSSGEEASQISIKERIKSIVAAEDPKKPLSDEAIGKALEEKDGISIARRTVTKYRKALEIPSSTQRRTY